MSPHLPAPKPLHAEVINKALGFQFPKIVLDLGKEFPALDEPDDQGELVAIQLAHSYLVSLMLEGLPNPNLPSPFSHFVELAKQIDFAVVQGHHLGGYTPLIFQSGHVK